MAKLQIGKSPEDLERERAEKERQREEEVQKASLERQNKIIALQKKQKLVKIIAIVIFVTLFISMMTFGIYNIFIKKNLTEEEVVGLARSQINYFPDTALNGYLRDNCEAIFQKYIKMDRDKYKSVKTDPNSVEVTRIIQINDTLTQAEWEVDVLVTELDSPVTDQEVVEKLKKVGFISENNNKTEVTTEKVTEKVTETPTEQITEETTEEVSSDEADSETTEETGSDNIPRPSPSNKVNDVDSNITEEQSEEETSNDDNASSMQILDSDGNVIKEVKQKDEDTSDAVDLQDIQKENENNNSTMNVNKATVINGEITLEDNKGNKETYYISGKELMKRGSTYTTRYSFTSPIEYYTEYDEDGTTPIRRGYRLASETSLQSFVRINQTDFEKITVNESYSFENIELVDEETLNSAQIKVDKTLDDLYSGRDTSQDVLLFHKFNTFDGTYVSLNDFKLYQGDNALGFNAYAEYTVQFNGFTYSAHIYLKLEKSGTSWVIKSFL